MDRKSEIKDNDDGFPIGTSEYGIINKDIAREMYGESRIGDEITYGEYLEKYVGINADSLFNAFIMPFNSAKNYFSITEIAGNIGEAVGDWRNNRKYYERIQGIVMDTRYLMYHYSGKPLKAKIALAECIEKVIHRPPVS